MNNNNSEDIKTSAKNLLMNVIIFILIALIIYLSYSMVLKMTGSEKIVEMKSADTEVAAEIIQTEVLNGCGVAGVADRFTDFMRSRNIDVVKMDNYKSFDVENSFVIDRIGNIANARKVARILGINPRYVIEQKNKDYFLDVTLVIGKDYYKLKPVKVGD